MRCKNRGKKKPHTQRFTCFGYILTSMKLLQFSLCQGEKYRGGYSSMMQAPLILKQQIYTQTMGPKQAKNALVGPDLCSMASPKNPI